MFYSIQRYTSKRVRLKFTNNCFIKFNMSILRVNLYHFPDHPTVSFSTSGNNTKTWTTIEKTLDVLAVGLWCSMFWCFGIVKVRNFRQCDRVFPMYGRHTFRHWHYWPDGGWSVRVQLTCFASVSHKAKRRQIWGNSLVPLLNR